MSAITFTLMLTVEPEVLDAPFVVVFGDPIGPDGCGGGS